MKFINKKTQIIIAVFAAVLIYFFFDARKVPFPKCPFYFITGFHCPGCGSQRALSALLHGDVLPALHYNVLLILFLPLLLYAAFMSFWNADARMRLWYNPVFGKIVLIVVCCFWVFRNIPLFPFTYLAPMK